MPAGEVNSFTSDQFDPAVLARSKNGATISVCLPARNEEETVGSIVEMIRGSLMDEHGLDTAPALVDEVIVMDDDSTDRTAQVAADAGARVVTVRDVLTELPTGSGKGNVLWKSVAACRGDLIVWIDADLTSFDTSYVAGLLGPLLVDPTVAMVKGFYQRPEHNGVGGGRTTEIMARPLISTFFPELAMIRQPLGGEYAARREVLERLPFCQGYGVETGLLIDIATLLGTGTICQVDLGVRTHRSRTLHDLSAQAMEVLHTVVQRAPGVEWNDQWSTELLHPNEPAVTVQTAERPPLVSCPEYLRPSDQIETVGSGREASHAD